MEFVEPIRDLKKIDAIKKILKSTNLRDYCFFVLGINSGLRISDLLRLKVEDVLSDSGKVKDRILIREQKTDKMKSFPINQKSKKAIEEYMRSLDFFEYDDPLFKSRKTDIAGKPQAITRNHAWDIMSKTAKMVGIDDKIGTHTLRKTFGYWAYKQGVDITRIQYTLNHSSPAVTLRYLGITQDELDDVYLNLNL